MSKKILITGSAGFIGFHLTKALLNLGLDVVGLDNMNSYYDPKLKQSRLDNINEHIRDYDLARYYKFVQLDISNIQSLGELFSNEHFDIVINLAAQAGVRYSLENPEAYINSNLVGFANILECCRNSDIEHLMFASSSSVYGMNIKQPFSVSDNTDFPISLYAATKKSNELLAHSYSHLFGIPCTGLRFFTVYGPYGRPDMAYYSFTKAIDTGHPINVFNNGKMERDFTYIDDIVYGICKLLDSPPSVSSNSVSNAEVAFQVFNLGNNSPVSLRRFIRSIEAALGKTAVENLLPMQPGDVPITYADIEPLKNKFGFKPSTTIEDGMKNFVEWYQSSKIR